MACLLYQPSLHSSIDLHSQTGTPQGRQAKRPRITRSFQGRGRTTTTRLFRCREARAPKRELTKAPNSSQLIPCLADRPPGDDARHLQTHVYCPNMCILFERREESRLLPCPFIDFFGLFVCAGICLSQVPWGACDWWESDIGEGRLRSKGDLKGYRRRDNQ